MTSNLFTIDNNMLFTLETIETTGYSKTLDNAVRD